MKIVTLAAPAAVNTGHPTRGYAELRQPIEGSLLVSDEEAQRLKDNNLLDGEPEEAPEPEGGEIKDPGDDLEEQKLEELGILVTKEGVPLNGATKKADIIAAIRKHRAEKAA